MAYELFVIIAIACVLVACCVFFLARRLPSALEQQLNLSEAVSSAEVKSARPYCYANEALASSLPTDTAKEKSRNDKNNGPLFIEYVPADINKLVIGFKASAQVQTELLAAGDTLLAKLPTDIRDCLGSPISCDRIDWLSQGGNPQDITPERARAAIAVAEASQALWMLMFDFGSRVNKFSFQLAIDEETGVLIAGNKIFLAPYITKRIIGSTSVNLYVATGMWRKIMEMLREGFVNIPGIRAKKSESEYAEFSVEV